MTCSTKSSNCHHKRNTITQRCDFATQWIRRIPEVADITKSNARFLDDVTRNRPPVDQGNIGEFIKATKNAFSRHFFIPVTILIDPNICTNAIIESGASSNYINHLFVSKHRLSTKKLNTSRPIYNIDGSRNATAYLTDYIELPLVVQGYTITVSFS